MNFHQYALNYIFQLCTSLTELISEDVLNPFMQSETLFNYNKLLETMYMIEEEAEVIEKRFQGRVTKYEASLKKL